MTETIVVQTDAGVFYVGVSDVKNDTTIENVRYEFTGKKENGLRVFDRVKEKPVMETKVMPEKPAEPKKKE